MKIEKLLIFCFLICISIVGCKKSSEENSMINLNDVVEVKLNQLGSDFAKQYPSLVRVNRQPVGLSFYKINWASTKKGNIKFKHGKNEFDINDAQAFFGTEDDEIKGEGMSSLNAISGMTGPDGISHQDALIKFFKILDHLEKTGWAPVIPFGEPRLSGKDMLSYLLRGNTSATLVASYVPSLDEWMKIENLTAWEFYSDRAFLQISFSRDINRMNTEMPGVYIVNYELNSEAEYFKGFVDPGQREKWQALLPAEIKDLEIRREKSERKLAEQGININREYRDPPLPK